MGGKERRDGTDRSQPVPNPDKTVPDLEVKLEEMQTPRGWGLFLIQNMVDEVRVSGSPDHHTIELVMHLEGGEDARSRHLGPSEPQ